MLFWFRCCCKRQGNDDFLAWSVLKSCQNGDDLNSSARPLHTTHTSRTKTISNNWRLRMHPGKSRNRPFHLKDYAMEWDHTVHRLTSMRNYLVFFHLILFGEIAGQLQNR
jgi:hypothetical protein